MLRLILTTLQDPLVPWGLFSADAQAGLPLQGERIMVLERFWFPPPPLTTPLNCNSRGTTANSRMILRRDFEKIFTV